MPTVTTYTDCECCGDPDGSGSGGGLVIWCDNFDATPTTLYLTFTGVTGSCNAGLVGQTVPLHYKDPRVPGGLTAGYVVLQSDLDALGLPCIAAGGYVGYPNNSPGDPAAFETSGCNIFGFGTNGYAGGGPTSADPFVYEGTWNYLPFPCCPTGPGAGSIDFTLSEIAP